MPDFGMLLFAKKKKMSAKSVFLKLVLKDPQAVCIFALEGKQEAGRDEIHGPSGGHRGTPG